MGKIFCYQRMHLVLALVLALPAFVYGSIDIAGHVHGLPGGPRGRASFHCDPDLLPCTDDGNGDACDCPSEETPRWPFSTSGCKTVKGEQCTFPFIYRGKTYLECTTVRNNGVLWCATDTRSDGSFINGKWGNCDSSSCTVHDDVPRNNEDEFLPPG